LVAGERSPTGSREGDSRREIRLLDEAYARSRISGCPA
jgi:hypothetical protein